MNFFKRYIAMPPQYGLFPYVWLIFLLFPIGYAFPYQTVKQQAIMGLILIFLVGLIAMGMSHRGIAHSGLSYKW